MGGLHYFQRHSFQLELKLLLGQVRQPNQQPVYALFRIHLHLKYFFRLLFSEQLPHPKLGLLILREHEGRGFCPSRHCSIVAEQVVPAGVHPALFPCHCMVRVDVEPKGEVCLLLFIFLVLQVEDDEQSVWDFADCFLLKLQEVIEFLCVAFWENYATVLHLNEPQFEADTPHCLHDATILRQVPYIGVAPVFRAKDYLHLCGGTFDGLGRAFVVVEGEQAELRAEGIRYPFPQGGGDNLPGEVSLNFGGDGGLAKLQVIAFVLQFFEDPLLELQQKVVPESISNVHIVGQIELREHNIIGR